MSKKLDGSTYDALMDTLAWDEEFRSAISEHILSEHIRWRRYSTCRYLFIRGIVRMHTHLVPHASPRIDADGIKDTLIDLTARYVPAAVPDVIEYLSEADFKPKRRHRGEGIIKASRIVGEAMRLWGDASYDVFAGIREELERRTNV